MSNKTLVADWSGCPATLTPGKAIAEVRRRAERTRAKWERQKTDGTDRRAAARAHRADLDLLRTLAENKGICDDPAEAAEFLAATSGLAAELAAAAEPK